MLRPSEHRTYKIETARVLYDTAFPDANRATILYNNLAGTSAVQLADFHLEVSLVGIAPPVAGATVSANTFYEGCPYFVVALADSTIDISAELITSSQPPINYGLNTSASGNKVWTWPDAFQSMVDFGRALSTRGTPPTASLGGCYQCLNVPTVVRSYPVINIPAGQILLFYTQPCFMTVATPTQRGYALARVATWDYIQL